MNKLTIQQGNTTENVSTSVIDKLYRLALSMPSNITLSGSIQTSAAYEDAVKYLAGKIGTTTNASGRFADLTITVLNDNYYIRFADATVEPILLAANYSSDGIGISKADAQRATSITSALFKNNTNLQTFNELGQFGSILIGKDAFRNCTNLTSIDLSTVTKIGDNAFDSCSSLSGSIALPALSDSGGLSQFKYCPITSVTDLGLVTKVPVHMFACCANLTSVLLPSSVTEIGGHSFAYTTNLTSFDFSNITTIGTAAFRESGISGALSIPNLTGDLASLAFRDCTGITSITNLGYIISVGNYSRVGYGEGTFQNCTSLTSVTLPSTIRTIGVSAFEGTSITQISGLENITTMKSAGFGVTTAWNFVVNLSNLVTIGSKSLCGNRSSRVIRLVYMPKVTTSEPGSYYSNDAYYAGSFCGIIADVIYFRDLQNLHPGDFARTTCNALVINNVTPPVWNNNNNRTDSEITNQINSKSRVFSGSTISNIYVPDSAVTTYQNDANWSSMASLIKPLSTLTKVLTEADLQSGQVALIEAYM